MTASDGKLHEERPADFDDDEGNFFESLLAIRRRWKVAAIGLAVGLAVGVTFTIVQAVSRRNSMPSAYVGFTPEMSAFLAPAKSERVEQSLAAADPGYKSVEPFGMEDVAAPLLAEEWSARRMEEHGLPLDATFQVSTMERSFDPAWPEKKETVLRFAFTGMDNNEAVDLLSEIVAVGIEEVRLSENRKQQERLATITSQALQVENVLAKKQSVLKQEIGIVGLFGDEIGALEKDLAFFRETQKVYQRYKAGGAAVVAAVQALVDQTAVDLAGLQDKRASAEAAVASRQAEVAGLEQGLAEIRGDEKRLAAVSEWAVSPLALKELPKKTVSPEFRGVTTLIVMGVLGLFFGCLAAMSWDSFLRRRGAGKSVEGRGATKVAAGKEYGGEAVTS